MRASSDESLERRARARQGMVLGLFLTVAGFGVLISFAPRGGTYAPTGFVPTLSAAISTGGAMMMLSGYLTGRAARGKPLLALKPRQPP